MENNTFKSVTFGGFAKQDVIDYIEKTSKAAAEQQEHLQQENDSLREQAENLSARLDGLLLQMDVLKKERDQLAEQLEQETAARKELEPAKPEVQRLAAEVERLRPDAEAYAQFRERIGAIECEARKRAADLESATVTRLEEMVAQFREKYQELTVMFDSTATHVTGELRKVEVNLTQLPRAMDQAGVELGELAALLEKMKKEP